MVGKVKIGTHNGTFHCDEVLACVMLKYASPEYSDAEIVRSRDMDVLNDCDVVVDVGGKFDPSCHRYDHHMRTFDHSMHSLNPEYPWTIKLSSAGLVYFHFGHQVISKVLGLAVDSEETKTLFRKIYENLIQEVDALDNGIEAYDRKQALYQIHTNLGVRVHYLNPPWNAENPDEMTCFKKASALVEQEFLDKLHYYGKVWLPARDIVKKAIENRKNVHPSGEIIEFADGGCPWKEHLFELEETLKVDVPIKFVLYSDTSGKWRVQCVSVSPFAFENRLSLYEPWRGLRDEELSKLSGIADCTFVHSSGFTGGNKRRDGVLEMAVYTLKSAQ